MSETPPILNWCRKGDASKTAIVFIHGFTGDHNTWGKFPDLIKKETALDGWDVATLAYRTSLAPGLLEGIWKGDPSLRTLAGLLDEIARTGGLRDYGGLALVAHSMGGLVVQRAVLDSPQLRERATHVFLYGTPSAGLKKASWFRRWKRQIKDMAEDGDFIRSLRRDWDAAFAKLRFVFRTVAGDEDQFVPPRSALGPFSKEHTSVVPGTHLTMVKPHAPDDLSVRVLVDGLQGKAAPSGPWNSARLALELQDFQSAVDQLMPQRSELDDRNLVTLALALDGLGRTDDALSVLEQAGRRGTDAQGVLGGRVKRLWLSEGRKADAERALNLYTNAYETSVAAEDWAQAYYHGINVAFLTALFLERGPDAAEIARRVLEHCERAERSHWSLATEAEARFYLGEWNAGLDKYADAIRADAQPREIESMYQQAVAVLARLAPRGERESLQKRLDGVFGW